MRKELRREASFDALPPPFPRAPWVLLRRICLAPLGCPLPANLYHNPLDWLLADAGFAMVRYSDDFVVLSRTPEQAQHVLEKIKAWTQEVELTLHPVKTRTVGMNVEKSHFDFLGYRFYRILKGKLTQLVRPRSEQKLRGTLKPLTQRNCGLSLEITIGRINPT